MSINCLIIDDEQWARELLQSYVTKFSFLKLLGKCKHLPEAKPFLDSNNVDLILLDINMPHESGIDFLRKQIHAPKVIFTTAYSEYALEGYNLEVVDYLLKPIGFERFQKAIHKAKGEIEMAQKVEAYEANLRSESQSMIVKEGYSLHRIYFRDILYIAAMREYVQYHLKNKKIMSLASLSSVEKQLNTKDFVRIHRSYIVAKNAVSTQKDNSIVLHNQVQLPLGKTFKARALDLLFTQ